MTSRVALHVRGRALDRARKARTQLLLLIPLIAGVVLAYLNREQLFGADLPVRVAAAIALAVLGFAFARSLGQALWPLLERRLEQSTAGTVGFVIRLVTLVAMLLVALRLVGLKPETLVVGGAVTAVILGLAAQQTIGNLIAGLVLISAQPFRVGDRVRLHAGGVAGQVEGSVVSLGLLYITMANGEDRIMVPNSVVLAAAVVPLREPSSVDVRARLPPSVRPSALHARLAEEVAVPTRNGLHVDLEEIEVDGLVVRVTGTPVRDADGPSLADRVVSALEEVAQGDQHAAT